LFAVLPLLLIVATPNAPNFHRFEQTDIWNISIHLAYLLALALIVFNGFYVKTWFHLLQILNIAFAAMAYFNAALAITGDG